LNNEDAGKISVKLSVPQLRFIQFRFCF
jgi:hypothetical protein